MRRSKDAGSPLEKPPSKIRAAGDGRFNTAGPPVPEGVDGVDGIGAPETGRDMMPVRHCTQVPLGA